MYTKYDDYVVRQADGAVIPMDPENSDCAAYLAWIDAGNAPDLPPTPSHAEFVEMAKAAMRIQRQPIISVLDGLQSSSVVKGEMPRALSIETAKQGLRDITDTDLSDCMSFEDMRLKVKAAYAALAAALPADVRKEFSEAIN